MHGCSLSFEESNFVPSNSFIYVYQICCCIEYVWHTPHDVPHQDPELNELVPFAVSLLSIALEKPEDGLPILEDWATTARDIYAIGFEGHRETIELRLHNKEMKKGDALGFACLLPNKGIGRISMLWFGLLWTWKKLSQDLTDDQTRDFGRPVTKGTSFFLSYGIKRVTLEVIESEDNIG